MTPTGMGAGSFRTPASPARLNDLPPYPLQDVPEIKARLISEGRVVIDLGAGDSRLPVPEVAVEALREAAGDPALQGYAFQRGLPAYREAVAGWMERRFGEPVDPWAEILPVIGSKEAIALAALALLDREDTVLIPDPGYAPYFGGAFFAGARIELVALRPENRFLVPPERIRDAPGLLEVPGGREIGLEFHSFSKTYNMTGWRLGWVCGNARLIADLRRVKTFFDTGSYLGIQAAGAAVLADADTFIQRTVTALRDRRDAAVRAFRGAGFELDAPLATLYLWLKVPGGDSVSWCRELLEREALVLMPGAALGSGGEGFARASLTVDPQQYAEVAARLKATA